GGLAAFEVAVSARLDAVRHSDERLYDGLFEAALYHPVGVLGTALADQPEAADLAGELAPARHHVPAGAESGTHRRAGVAALAEPLVVPVLLPRRDDGAPRSVLAGELGRPHLALLGVGADALGVGQPPGPAQRRCHPDEDAVVVRPGRLQPGYPRGPGAD